MHGTEYIFFLSIWKTKTFFFFPNTFYDTKCGVYHLIDKKKIFCMIKKQSIPHVYKFNLWTVCDAIFITSGSIFSSAAPCCHCHVTHDVSCVTSLWFTCPLPWPYGIQILAVIHPGDFSHTVSLILRILTYFKYGSSWFQTNQQE